MKIGKIYTFEAAHYLPGHPKCGVMHGHSYKVEVLLEGPVKESGMVLDFGELDYFMNPIISQFDHTTLNLIVGLETPTAENICTYIKEKLLVNLITAGSFKVKVKLWETARCWAES